MAAIALRENSIEAHVNRRIKGVCKALEGVLHPAQVVDGNDWPDGVRVYGRLRTGFSRRYGTVKGRRLCQLEGCSGLQLRVVWSDGHWTWCCTKGLIQHPKGMRLA